MFDPSLLPSPEIFYRQEFSRMTRASRGWAQTRCVFPGHDDRIPSLSVNLREGNFVCHGCGLKGGDIVDFIQRRDGLSFREACEQLGAWTHSTAEANQKAQSERERHKRERTRIEAARQTLETEQKRLRIELREYLHTLDFIDREITCRLRQDGEEETYWHILSLLPDEKRRTLAAHDLLAFGSAEDRIRFVLNETAREEMISAVLWSGHVRTDDGKLVEVPL